MNKSSIRLLFTRVLVWHKNKRPAFIRKVPWLGGVDKLVAVMPNAFPSRIGRMDAALYAAILRQPHRMMFQFGEGLVYDVTSAWVYDKLAAA